MDVLLSSHSIGISDLREAPARAFEQASEHAVVVLNHNKPAGYIVSEKWMTRVLDQMADMSLMTKVDARMPNLHTARLVTLDDL